jgi:hypothetical protein
MNPLKQAVEKAAEKYKVSEKFVWEAIQNYSE